MIPASITSTQKVEIWRLRQRAYSYARISEKLGIPLLLVEQAAERLESERLAAERKARAAELKKAKPLTKAPKAKAPAKEAEREERGAIHHETPSGRPPRPCNRCGREFEPTRTRWILCSPCYRGVGNSYSWGNITG